MKYRLNRFCDWIMARYSGHLKDDLMDDYYLNPDAFPLSLMNYFPSLFSDDLLLIWEHFGPQNETKMWIGGGKLLSDINLDKAMAFRDKCLPYLTVRETIATVIRSHKKSSLDDDHCLACDEDLCKCCCGVCKHL